MKKTLQEFFRRGLVAGGFGPIVLAILYLILNQQNLIEVLTVQEVCVGIFSLSGLAFVAGGMNVVYQMERLPLTVAILIHGSILYLSYLATYLLNGWLQRGLTAVLVFTGIFIFGYLVIWAIIYWITKKNTEQINALLKQKQHPPTDQPL